MSHRAAWCSPSAPADVFWSGVGQHRICLAVCAGAAQHPEILDKGTTFTEVVAGYALGVTPGTCVTGPWSPVQLPGGHC